MFILYSIGELQQVKYLSHPAPYPGAVNLFDLGAVEVGDEPLNYCECNLF